MLSELLAPLSVDEFLSRYWTREFVHVPGPPDKFARTYDWDRLNRTLEAEHFQAGRLSLVKNGQWLQPQRFLAGEKVVAARLLRELADGATLVFKACEDVHPPLRALCEALERLFHVRVFTNLYAGWRADNGFAIHWDDQDTLILQVSGRKAWKVWAPTRLHPFKEDVVDTSPATKPEGPPVWEGVLEQGGLLSMPRGWWHVAYPMNEPSLHLTVTITSLNGIDFLHWFADQMKASETARMELPVVAAREARQIWLASLWRDMQDAWAADLIDRHLAQVDAAAIPRPVLHLPALVRGDTGSIGADTPLELAGPRALRFRQQDGRLRFSAGGDEWEATGDLLPVLERFNDGQPHTLAEVGRGHDGTLTAVVKTLVAKGVLRPVGPTA
jgi:ribosomal protein L16 Arg81 hydroxylase